MKIKLLSEKAILPTRGTPWSAGLDLYALEYVKIPWGEWQLIGTGVAVEMADGWVGMVCPRSGLAYKYGLTVLNAPGIIDSDYRGEIKVNLINNNMEHEWIAIEPGDKIAQLVITNAVFPKLEVVDTLNDTVRGINGHGSTGR